MNDECKGNTIPKTAEAGDVVRLDLPEWLVELAQTPTGVLQLNIQPHDGSGCHDDCNRVWARRGNPLRMNFTSHEQATREEAARLAAANV